MEVSGINHCIKNSMPEKALMRK